MRSTPDPLFSEKISDATYLMIISCKNREKIGGKMGKAAGHVLKSRYIYLSRDEEDGGDCSKEESARIGPMFVARSTNANLEIAEARGSS